MFRSLDISTSGLVAQRLRMDTIAGNIAQANTTVDEDGNASPFQRRLVTFQSSQRDSQAAPGGHAVEARVEVDTQTPYRIVHQPGHPQADAEGNVRFPNVNVITEFVNAVEASRAYEANLSAMEITKTMIQGAFKILG